MATTHNCVDEIRAYYENAEAARHKVSSQKAEALAALTKAQASGASARVCKTLRERYLKLEKEELRVGYVGD
jgi:hypothetical protein